MTSKRASLLTVKSLTALSKVCYVGNPSDAIRTLNLLRSLSTAIERSEFQNPNGYNIDESSEFNQKPSSFNTESQNLKGLQQNTNWQGLNSNGGLQQDQIRDHGWNPDGQHGSSSGVSGQSYGSQQNLYQNRGDGYTDGRSEYQNRFSGQNGTFDGYHGQNYGNLKRSPSVIHMENSREFEQNTNHFQNHGGVYEEGTRIDSHQNTNWQVLNPNGGVQQGPTSNYGWNPAGQHWNHSGVYGQSYGGSQQNFYQSSTDGYRVVRNKHPNDMSGQSGTFNGCHEQNDGTLKQSPSGVYMESPREFEQNSNHFHQNHGGVHEEGKRNDSLEEFDDFVKEGRLKEAVEVLGSLEKLSVPVVFSRIFQLMEACGDANALEEAKAVHQHILRSPCLIKVSTYNRILKMYSKCGSMDDAFDVFNNMRERNLTTWDTMITWLAKNGLGEDAVDLFSQFKQAGLKPDGQMFIGVFSACGALGDIHEGMLHFKSMSDDYGIVPSMKHYISIVDMLGSTGYLDEALEFIGKMPMEPSVDIWETLMNLSRIHGNLELGDHCAETIELLDPSRLNEKSKAGLIPVDDLELAKEKEKKKLANRDLLEVRSRVHEYRAGDTSHPQTDKIYAQIRGLKAQMKEAGYIPETRFVLHDIDQEGKEEALLAHSERLAVSHGLLSSPPRAPIRIIKNLRVCGDCHSALKIISKIVGRELIIRDAKRFHHFKDGLCSCRDYW